jgi:hypothetical protein
MQICAKCGQPFDGDKCWICVARLIDIRQTFLFSLPVALAGLLGVGMAATYYAPLENRLLHDFLLLVMLVLPGAMIFLLVSFDRLTRYAFIFRMTLVLAAATPIMTAAFLYMNGAWDQEAVVATQALVSGKHISGGGTRSGADLHVTLHWKQRRIEEDLDVLRQTYEAVVPNDSINIIVHPGEFSLPWYSLINPESVQRQISPQE